MEPPRPKFAQASPQHELMNMLQAVQGYLELLASRELDETAQRYLTNARTAADQMAALIQNNDEPDSQP